MRLIIAAAAAAAAAIAILLVGSLGAHAQTMTPAELDALHQLPPPPVPLEMTPADRDVIAWALAKLKADIGTLDPTLVLRIAEVERGAEGGMPLSGPRQLPIVGMALSRGSANPNACALLKRIEPSAVCVR